jgi:hypothetical protein
MIYTGEPLVRTKPPQIHRTAITIAVHNFASQHKQSHKICVAIGFDQFTLTLFYSIGVREEEDD